MLCWGQRPWTTLVYRDMPSPHSIALPQSDRNHPLFLQFTKAVEAKQVAQQEAERARFVVMKADQERKAAVIRAEGESESAKLISGTCRMYCWWHCMHKLMMQAQQRDCCVQRSFALQVEGWCFCACQYH